MRPGVLCNVRPASPATVMDDPVNVVDRDKEGLGVGGELAEARLLRELAAVVDALLRKEEDIEEVGAGPTGCELRLG